MTQKGNQARSLLAVANTEGDLAVMTVWLAALALAAAWLLLLLDIDPVATWFYVFAWYPALVLADATTRSPGSKPSLFRSPASIASVFGWSAIVWLVFEVANFRLRNWYYVFLPDAAVERWAGILVSFATVVPAVVLAERLLDSAGVGHSWRTAPLRYRSRDLQSIQGIGLGVAALALLAPRTFFPLIWGAAWLLADPIVFRRRPDWSLLGDLSRGEWGRIGRLMLGGLGIGLAWEFLNFWARGKWVYTVPWLEGTKLFEMPPLGFLGFPFFALEAWALYHLLCVVGVAVPVVGAAVKGDRGGRTDDAHPSPFIAPHRLASPVLLAAAFAALTLIGMEQRTISSVTPQITQMPGISAIDREIVAGAGFGSAFALAKVDPDTLAARSGIPSARAAQLVEVSRLVVLRGIGTVHATRLDALGVSTVCALGRRSPAVLWQAYHHTDEGQASVGRIPGPDRPTPAEVRVWVGAARRECAGRWEVEH